MSRCEHGEVISVFCINQSCSWREAGGCPQCIKKYHSHPITSDIITQQRLEQLFKSMLAKPDLKIKNRQLQQALYNYFMIMKSQISSSLDAVSREINNRLGHPYVHTNGHLGTFKKIKNREYKKITKTELINFYKFATQTKHYQFEKQQKALYLAEVDRVSQVMQEINQFFNSYSQTISKIDTTFNTEKTFYEKIQEISKLVRDSRVRTQQSQKNTSDGASNSRQKNRPQFLSIPNSIKKDRKVSIDTHSVQNSQISKYWSGHYQQKQKQIENRKKKLLDMLNSSSQKKNLAENIQKIQVNFEQEKQQNLQQKNQRQKDFNKSVKKQQKQISVTNIFNDFMAKGINIPEIILAQTDIPRQPSRKKLYDQSQDVQQKKIKVKVNDLNQNQVQEISSPLLKKRRQKKIQQGLQLKRVQSEYDKEQQQTLQQQAEDQKLKDGQKKSDQQIVIKQQQAQSLALLIKSLTLPAEKAIPMLETAIKISDNNLSAAQYLTYLYIETSKPKQCLDLCNKFLEQLQYSNNSQQLSLHLNNNKAAALNILGRYSESISILEKCLQISEKDISYKNMGDAFFCLGIYQKAIINYEKALILNRHLDEALYNLAVCHFMQQHLHEAKLHISRALKINPNNENYNQLHKEIMIKIQI